jgi:cytochrome d ubiquinol oxidase subunit I
MIHKSNSMDAYLIHRIQFSFTVMFHYIFPQLTMGLSLLIVILKILAVLKKDDHYNKAARFWAKIFALNFAIGVVTGIPMEFQFGTNWAKFSAFAGGVIGQTLAMEGMFAFFLESAFLGLFLFGEKKLGPKWHLVSTFLVFLGSWISGFFIIVTNAWMQLPVGFNKLADGTFQLASFGELMTNPWLFWQFVHNMSGAVITASFVMAAIGAYYMLSNKHTEYAKTFLKLGIITGVVVSIFQAFPSGDGQGKNVALYQPSTLSAMEGLFDTENGASLVILGQPDVEKLTLDNPIKIPNLLSFLTYNRWKAQVKGLKDYPRDQWPDNIPLLYYSYHIMVGLGTIFIGIMLIGCFLLWRRKLFTSRWYLWILLLSFPFPYIANTTGWMTAELGRQPWLIYGMLRTSEGMSANVSSGNALFTLLGFAGLYLLLGILFIVLVLKEINHGPYDGKEHA